MAELASLVQRLEVAVGRLESMSGPGGSGGNSAGGAVSAYVEAFDVIVSGPVAQYLSLSQKIGGDVQKHADMMKQAFSSQRILLITASSSQKPSDAVLTTLLQPVSKAIQQVQTFREQNRSSPQFNHLSAVSESVPALGWIAMAPKPCPYVKEMQDAAMFYTNRVLKEFKEKDQTHVDWVKAYLSIWAELQNYIKEHHTTGLTWSKSGAVASTSAAPPSAPAGGCPPPPPPGPPPPAMDLSGSSGGGGDSGADNRNALFAAINKGSNITSGRGPFSTDGCHVYLSKDSLSCEIVSAKSSEMNILVPNKDGEFTEMPVPEQFKTIWDGNKLITTATEIAG
uniref:Adenylyl cyclase-associated protein n=1 Tax=Sander lucioperca TaxID=283035 RepID=A0A8C9XIK9_SANLU